MADISIVTPGCCPRCDDDCGCHEEGKRGKRGHRGHRGHQGPPGPPGPSGFGLLKFSAAASADSEGGTSITTFLADGGTDATASGVAPSYPIAVKRRIRNLATNVLGFTVPSGGSITIDLLLNGSPVAGFSTSYGTGEGGIKQVTAGPLSVSPGDTLDVRVITAVLAISTVLISATLGVE